MAAAKRHPYKGQMMTVCEIVAASGSPRDSVYQAIKYDRLDHLGSDDRLGREIIICGNRYCSIEQAARDTGLIAKTIREAMGRAKGAATFKWRPKKLGRTLTITVLPRRRKLRT